MRVVQRVAAAWLVFAAVAAAPGIIACGGEEPPRSPAIAPLPKSPSAPADNPTTGRKAALGKMLFFDPRLSGDNTLSCASCHIPEKALADGLATGKGFGGKRLDRNTPTLWNAAFLPAYFWDGRAASLEEQALGPIENPGEMNQDLDELERELAAVPGYVQEFKEAFDGPPDRANVSRALAAFQRTLVSGPSPVDRYLAGDKKALADDAQRGLELFTGTARCVRCHNGPLLSDGKFYRLGVSYRDAGRGGVTGDKADRYTFRTPPLRNVAHTGPYMHDGSMSSLTEVVEFYLRGAPAGAPDGLKPDIEPLFQQSFSDIEAIVAFLQALSGPLPKIDPPELP
jgi:cytochrome c peroxidase